MWTISKCFYWWALNRTLNEPPSTHWNKLSGGRDKPFCGQWALSSCNAAPICAQPISFSSVQEWTTRFWWVHGEAGRTISAQLAVWWLDHHHSQSCGLFQCTCSLIKSSVEPRLMPGSVSHIIKKPLVHYMVMQQEGFLRDCAFRICQLFYGLVTGAAASSVVVVKHWNVLCVLWLAQCTEVSVFPIMTGSVVATLFEL